VGNNPELVRNSRWFRAAPPFAPGMELEAYLAKLPFPIGVPISCSDSWTHRLAGLSGPIAQRFPTGLPQLPVLEQLLDKGRFAKALEKSGVPHPLTISLTGPAGLDAIPVSAYTLGFFKPCNSQAFFKRFGVNGFWVRSRAEAESRLAEVMRENLTVLFQEYVPGPENHHYLIDGFIDSSKQVTAILARRRLRMYPIDFGNSTFMVSVDCTEAALAIKELTRFLIEIGYCGIFSAEFKLDERDGVFKILEVNTRPWWYVEFAAQCGVDVVTLAYKGALGQISAPAGGYATGKKLVYPYYDYFACRELIRRGQFTPRAWARDWIGSLHPVFKWDDPFPSVVVLWNKVTGYWGRS
jgi:D-aspartate ligase